MCSKFESKWPSTRIKHVSFRCLELSWPWEFTLAKRMFYPPTRIISHFWNTTCFLMLCKISPWLSLMYIFDTVALVDILYTYPVQLWLHVWMTSCLEIAGDDAYMKALICMVTFRAGGVSFLIYLGNSLHGVWPLYWHNLGEPNQK